MPAIQRSADRSSLPQNQIEEDIDAQLRGPHAEMNELAFHGDVPTGIGT